MKRHKVLKIPLALFAVLLLLALAAFLFARQILTVDSGPVKGDVLVVLGGGGVERPARALELFRQGAAPRILVSGKGDCGWIKMFLERNGVAGTAITVEDQSRTTRQNAEFSIPLLRRMGAHRVIIVTSWFHSRRALACFEHYAPDLEFYSRPAAYIQSKDQRQQKHISGEIGAEYVKLIGYWVCYGVCPI